MNDKNKEVVKQALKTYKAIEMAKPSALNGGWPSAAQRPLSCGACGIMGRIGILHPSP